MQTDNSDDAEREFVRLDRGVMISYKVAGSSEGYDMTNTKDISKGGTFCKFSARNQAGDAC